jgi:hypothetical protein
MYRGCTGTRTYDHSIRVTVNRFCPLARQSPIRVPAEVGAEGRSNSTGFATPTHPSDHAPTTVLSLTALARWICVVLDVDRVGVASVRES